MREPFRRFRLYFRSASYSTAAKRRHQKQENGLHSIHYSLFCLALKVDAEGNELVSN
jgi:hypothetical protein